MTDLREWARAEQHLVPDAIVAYVDSELSATAHDRVAAHLARCPLCAAEMASQRQARAAVRAAASPVPPASLLASLRSIPMDIDSPMGPGELTVTEDGQLVSMVRQVAANQQSNTTAFGAGPALGSAARLGSSQPLGYGSAVLGRGKGVGRRAWHGAGIVVSGIVLGALVLVSPTVPVQPTEPAGQQPPEGGPAVLRQADRAAVPVHTQPAVVGSITAAATTSAPPSSAASDAHSANIPALATPQQVSRTPSGNPAPIVTAK